MNFESVHGAFPPRRSTKTPKHGWGPYLLGHMEQKPLGDAYDLDQDFYAPVNQPLIRIPLSVFICPSAPGERLITIIDQAGNSTGAVGAAGDYFTPNSVDAFWWPPDRRAAASDTVNCSALKDNAYQPLANITDGLSNTLLIAEFAGRPDHWINGRKQPTNDGLRWPNWWGPILRSSKPGQPMDRRRAGLAQSIATTIGESTLFIPEGRISCCAMVRFILFLNRWIATFLRGW